MPVCLLHDVENVYFWLILFYVVYSHFIFTFHILITPYFIFLCVNLFLTSFPLFFIPFFIASNVLCAGYAKKNYVIVFMGFLLMFK